MLNKKEELTFVTMEVDTVKNKNKKIAISSIMIPEITENSIVNKVELTKDIIANYLRKKTGTYIDVRISHDYATDSTSIYAIPRIPLSIKITGEAMNSGYDLLQNILDGFVEEIKEKMLKTLLPLFDTLIPVNGMDNVKIFYDRNNKELESVIHDKIALHITPFVI